MAICPKCSKHLDECASWPGWGVQLCVLTHRALDCEGMDDILEDLGVVVQPGQMAQYAALQSKLERELTLKTKNPNRKCIKNLSSQLAYKMVSEPSNSMFRLSVRSKLGVSV